MKKVNFILTMVAEEETALSMDLMDEDADMSVLFDQNNPSENTEDTDTDISSENLFDTEDSKNPEIVGAEHQESEGNPSSTSSPSIISSILTALKDDGVLSDVDVELINNAKTAEDFANIINVQIEARFSQEEKRIKDALEVGIAPDAIKQYEGVISYLNQITEDTLDEQSDSAEGMRKDLIYQDFVNRGFTPERAKREVEKSFAAGTDTEDARSALESNKEFFNTKYTTTIAQEKAKVDAIKAKEKKQKDSFAKLVTETAEPFTGVKLDAVTRKKILDNATKPVEKTSNGDFLTPMQKAMMEDPVKYSYYQSLFFTLTDGYKDINKLIGNPVATATKRVTSNIEKVLNSSSNFSDSGNTLFQRDDNSKALDFKIDI